MRLPEVFERRKRAYMRLLLDSDGRVSPDAAFVLADLKRFCYVDKSTLIVSPVTKMTDTHATMVAEGRREVWNRIQAYLRLDDRQLGLLTENERDERSGFTE